jgi:hypothetical protein
MPITEDCEDPRTEVQSETTKQLPAQFGAESETLNISLCCQVSSPRQSSPQPQSHNRINPGLRSRRRDTLFASPQFKLVIEML